MNDTVRRRRNQSLQLSCTTRSALPGKTQSKLTSAGRVLLLLCHRQRSGLATGIAVLLCLMCSGCTGFFINPAISSIFITPSAATLAAKSTLQLTATATYSDQSTQPSFGFLGRLVKLGCHRRHHLQRRTGHGSRSGHRNHDCQFSRRQRDSVHHRHRPKLVEHNNQYDTRECRPPIECYDFRGAGNPAVLRLRQWIGQPGYYKRRNLEFV